MKAVILAGGTGTRLYPMTKIINKHLLPVGPYPMICLSLIRLRDSGIKQILIVTNNNDLDTFEEIIGTGEAFGVSLQYAVQSSEGAGIADALRCAKEFIKQDKFIVLLGDNLFEEDLTPCIEAFKKQKEGARILLKKVEDPHRYGVATLDEMNKKITLITEKPTSPDSSFCVTGIYMYDQTVFSLIDQISPSNRDELEISDVNNLYIKDEKLEYEILNGWWIDAGTHESLYKANHYFYNSPVLRDEVMELWARQFS